MAGQGEQDSNEQTAWEEVVSGKRLPVAGQWADEEAESVRQALLWRQARERAAHALSAHSLELHPGLVPPPENTQRAVFQHVRLRAGARR